jgi:photosystem II stability/assembly factor-like uncharacterized protein
VYETPSRAVVVTRNSQRVRRRGDDALAQDHWVSRRFQPLEAGVVGERLRLVALGCEIALDRRRGGCSIAAMDGVGRDRAGLGTLGDGVRRRRRAALFFACAVVVSCLMGGVGAGAAVVSVRVTDVSPDAPCCAREASADPSDEGGQMDGVAADPGNPLIAYAAGEQSGVWKTVDGGQHWRHSSGGLATGETNGIGPFEAEPALAVDSADGKRLLYAAADDDLAPGFAASGFGHRGGLYASLDGAGRWTHVSLPGCPAPSVEGVAFGGGSAYAATACGVAVSTDPGLGAWKVVHPNGAPAGLNEDIWTIAAQGSAVFACDNDTNRVYRSPDRGASWLLLAVPGASNCWSLAGVPDDTNKFVMVDENASSQFRVLLVDMSTQQSTELTGFPQPNGSPSGRPYVSTVFLTGHLTGQGPGRSYSVFASNGDRLFELGAGTTPSWTQLGKMHIDQHGLASASNYDPDHGHCTLYIANDGGVYRTSGAHKPCRVHSSVVRKVMHGLHAFGSFALGLVRQTRCPAHVAAPCPGLYLGANDNGTFGSAVGGHGRGVWHDLHCCGDSGAVLTDWRLPNRVVTPRGASWELHVSANGRPPVGASSDSVTDIATAGIGIGAQVQTLPGAHVPSKGIYFAIRTLDGADQLIRDSLGTAGGWRARGPTLPASSITGLQVADGGATIYALSGATGKVITLGRAGTGQLVWQDRSSGLTFADDLIVDPFDGQILYATDLGDPNSMTDDRIMASTDGGRSWHEDVFLTRLAQDQGRFRMACGDGLGDAARVQGTVNTASTGFRYQCTLQAMAFDPSHPNRRFALLDPAGVAFSRDAGMHWVRLPVSTEIDRPTQAFFDPTRNPATGQGSLYVALHGHGLERVDANWSRLSIPTSPPPAPPPPPPPLPPPPPTGGSSVSLICPARANFPGFRVTGALSPPMPEAAIHVTVDGPPSVGTKELTATTDANGDYSLLFGGPVGRYTLQAFYAGDVDHRSSSSPSCAVQIFPPPG